MQRLNVGLLFISVAYLAMLLAGCGGGSSDGQTTGSFTLSSSPGFATVTQGRQTTSTITIVPQNGFSGSVNLSISALPNGVTATFEPSSATTASTLTLAASATAATGPVTLAITGTSGASTSSTSLNLTVDGQIQAGLITHVVIIFQENRTPDNLFHDTVLMSRGADIATQGLIANGQTIPLTPVSLVTTYDLDHVHASFLQACDYNSANNTCAMDGAYQIGCGPSGCPTYPQYQYVQPSDVQPYFTMAETYTFGDRMFQTNEGPSFPAHQYILAGTSRIDATSTISAADNPLNTGGQSGCLAAPGADIDAIDISQASPETPETLITQLCFEHPTLTDLLDAANLSWKYYVPTAGSIWTAPDAIQHICVPEPPYPSESSVCTGADWTNNVVLEGSGAQILTDIANGQLANVSWVIPTGSNSDHAGNSEDNGPSWVASIVNQIGNPEYGYWPNTAIIVTWDDWGGWYDHQPPPAIRDSYEYGLRVPLIVISPYAKPQYISHQLNDFGSILKFVEENFSLGEIDPAVGYADSYTTTDDLSDCFDFKQTPLTFTPIPAVLKAEHFLNDKSPPTPPDND